MAQRLAEQVWIEDQAAMNAQYGAAKNGTETDTPQTPEEDEIREAMYYRLERLGYRVGLGLVESYVLSHFPFPHERMPALRDPPSALPSFFLLKSARLRTSDQAS